MKWTPDSLRTYQTFCRVPAHPQQVPRQHTPASTHPSNAEIFRGTGSEDTSKVTPSTGTLHQQCRWPRKKSIKNKKIKQSLCICPLGKSPDQLPATVNGQGVALLQMPPHLGTRVREGSKVLQWLIADVPSRGHCDIKESHSARQRMGIQLPQLSLEHLPSSGQR